VDVSRLFSQQNETQRLFQSAVDTLYDYAVQRATSSTRLGGIAGLSYRLSPGSTVHVRGFYTNVADNEVRTYQGPDHNRDEPIRAAGSCHKSSRLMYVQRTVAAGTVEGQHQLARRLDLDWKVTRSGARRQQPDRRGGDVRPAATATTRTATRRALGAGLDRQPRVRRSPGRRLGHHG
jgi:hypothetical protein